jgi:predicted RNA-binding Zn-ribbon protein involved in translation (DUF1610 family)
MAARRSHDHRLPICKSTAQELRRTGHATDFHCPRHGDFKVADSAFAKAKAKDYTREQWEEQRAEPDVWPLIITDDFHWSLLSTFENYMSTAWPQRIATGRNGTTHQLKYRHWDLNIGGGEEYNN